MKKIAVIGATGMLGIPVVTELVRAGFEVTALVRDPAKAKRSLPAGAKIVAADAADLESLKYGLRGQDAVYLSLSVSPAAKKDDFHAEAQGLENILAAAEVTGVRRVAYLSALIQDSANVNWWVIEIWRNAIARIKTSGIPYTIFYASNFMETISQRHVFLNILTIIGRSRHQNYWIAGSDFGKQVVASFQLPDIPAREYAVQGPEPLTYDEAQIRFAQHCKKKLFVVRVPIAALSCLGYCSASMDFYARIMSAVLEYPEHFKASATWKDLGVPATTLEEFAKAH